jgi:hypothetical protein
MFVRNFERNGALATTTTIQQLIRARRKMRLSDAIRSGSGEAARRGVDNGIAALTFVGREGRWPIEGIHVDWQLEEPEVADVIPFPVFYPADWVEGQDGAGWSLAQRM